MQKINGHMDDCGVSWKELVTSEEDLGLWCSKELVVTWVSLVGGIELKF